MKKKLRAPSRSQADKQESGLDRRTFVKLLPAVGAASLAATDADSLIALAEQPQQPQTPQRITKEMLHTAEQLIGLELDDAQEAMALPGVNRNLTGYEALRKIDVPLDTEPATAFHPAPPGKTFNRAKTKLKPSKVELPQFNTVEDLAFATTAQLAELVRTRKVTSTELTKMYLARLKK